MRKLFIIIALVTHILGCSKAPSEFHGVPVFPESRLIEKAESSLINMMTVVTSRKEEEVLNFYTEALGNEAKVSKVNHATSFHLNTPSQYPTIDNLKVLVSSEVDGTEINIMFSSK
jgi:hypothetical protein